MSSLLESLDAGTRAELLAAAARRRFAAGRTLLLQGHRSDRILLLTAGRVRITRTAADGREITLASRAAGDVLGELAAIDGEPHTSTVTAETDVECLELTGPEFAALLDRAPAARDFLLRSLAGRLREATAEREAMLLDVQGRLARRLLLLRRAHAERGADDPMLLDATHEELAAWLGCTREAVSKALGALRRQGILGEAPRGRLRLLDVGRLEKLIR